MERFRIELIKSPLTPLACLVGRKRIAKEGNRREEFTHSITRRPTFILDKSDRIYNLRKRLYLKIQ